MEIINDTMQFKREEVIHLRCQSLGALSKELEEYFLDILNACFGVSEDRRYRAFQSLQHDPNMVPMAVYISKFISDQTIYYAVNPELKNMTIVMKMAHHIVRNGYVKNIKQYLHEILPAVMTCIVCSTLSAAPQYENHWNLRMYASDLLRYICENFSSSVNRIKERVIKVLRNALLDPSKDFATVYGVLFALKTLGYEVIKHDIHLIETVVKKRVDDFLTQAFPIEKDKQSALRIKDLISQILSMETASKNIPKSKPKVVNKDQRAANIDSKTSSNARNSGTSTSRRTLVRKQALIPKPAPALSVSENAMPVKEVVESKLAVSKPMPIPRILPQGQQDKSNSYVSTPAPVAAQPKSDVQNKSESVPARPHIPDPPKSTPELVPPAFLFHTYMRKAAPRPRPLPLAGRSTKSNPFVKPTTTVKPVPISKRPSASSTEVVAEMPMIQPDVTSAPTSTTSSNPQGANSFITVTCPTTSAGPQFIFVPRVTAYSSPSVTTGEGISAPGSTVPIATASQSRSNVEQPSECTRVISTGCATSDDSSQPNANSETKSGLNSVEVQNLPGTTEIEQNVKVDK